MNCVHCDGWGCRRCTLSLSDLARDYGETGPDECDLGIVAARKSERQRCASMVLAWAESQEALGREEGAAVLRALAAAMRAA